MKTIFDFGMFDASDTEYYLAEGYKVVAVEANPALAQRAQAVLSEYITRGQLQIVNAAIAIDNRSIELTVSGEDLGSSSIYEETVAARVPLGKFTVPGITTQQLIEQFGIPYYLKIDIEGADHLCVKALSADRRPEFLSFEVGDEFEPLLAHLASIGYAGFKLINQAYFREFANEGNLRDRISRKIIRSLGYAEPQYVRRGGRYFKLGHSSGPVPWRSDGPWCSSEQLLHKWKRAFDKTRTGVWYDLHASLNPN